MWNARIEGLNGVFNVLARYTFWIWHKSMLLIAGAEDEDCKTLKLIPENCFRNAVA